MCTNALSCHPPDPRLGDLTPREPRSELSPVLQLVELGFNAEDAESNRSIHSEAAARLTLAKVIVTDRSIHKTLSFKPSTIQIKVGEETRFLFPYGTDSEYVLAPYSATVIQAKLEFRYGHS